VKKQADHIVSEGNGATAHCLNCDKKFTLVLPAPLAVWAAAMKEFCKLHVRCKPPILKGEKCLRGHTTGKPA
jgi:hypothetical protein